MGESCEDILPLLPWFVAETIGPHEKLPVFEHLRSCSACRYELAQWVNLRHTTASVLAEKPNRSVIDGTWLQLKSQISVEECQFARVHPLVGGMLQQQGLEAPLGIVGAVVDLVKIFCTHHMFETTARTACQIRDMVSLTPTTRPAAS
jgi:hypothetical protein